MVGPSKKQTFAITPNTTTTCQGKPTLGKPGGDQHNEVGRSQRKEACATHKQVVGQTPGLPPSDDATDGSPGRSRKEELGQFSHGVGPVGDFNRSRLETVRSSRIACKN